MSERQAINLGQKVKLKIKLGYMLTSWYSYVQVTVHISKKVSLSSSPLKHGIKWKLTRYLFENLDLA